MQEVKQTQLKPTGSRVLVKIKDVESATKGGIVLVESAQDKPQTGEILALGSDQHNFVVQVGDLITFGQFAGVKIEHQGEEFLLIKEQDILAIIEK